VAFDEQPDGDPHGECAAEIHRLEADLAKAHRQIEVYEEALDGVCVRCFWSGKAEEAQGYQAWSRTLHGTKDGIFVCSRCLKPEDEHGGAPAACAAEYGLPGLVAKCVLPGEHGGDHQDGLGGHW
jgi:hypothetical protein